MYNKDQKHTTLVITGAVVEWRATNSQELELAELTMSTQTMNAYDTTVDQNKHPPPLEALYHSRSKARTVVGQPYLTLNNTIVEATKRLKRVAHLLANSSY